MYKVFVSAIGLSLVTLTVLSDPALSSSSKSNGNKDNNKGNNISVSVDSNQNNNGNSNSGNGQNHSQSNNSSNSNSGNEQNSNQSSNSNAQNDNAQNNSSSNDNSGNGQNKSENSIGVCNTSDVTATVLGIATSATACQGELPGNDGKGEGSLLLGNLNNLFNVNYNWTFGAKIDLPAISAGDFGIGAGGQSGTWNVTNAITGALAISIKGSNGYSVYLFDNLSKVTSGTWSTLGIKNPGKDSPDLSHISFFFAPQDTPVPPPTPVPEPGTAGALGLFTLGSLSFLKKKRS